MVSTKNSKQQKEAAGVHTQGSDFAGPFTCMSCAHRHHHALPGAGERVRVFFHSLFILCFN
jgi:hypothetical protein